MAWFDVEVVLADAWYNSSLFGAILGVVATLVVGGVGSWLTYLWTVPKRRLDYWLSSETPLVTAPSELRHDLEVRHRGVVLTEPHVLEIRLASRGRRDIPRESFDGGQPIRLDVGVLILRILGSDSDIASVHQPTVKVDGTALEIGPALLKKRNTLTYRLLVDGPDPRLTCKAELADVDVPDRPRAPSTERRLENLEALLEEIAPPFPFWRLSVVVTKALTRILPRRGRGAGGSRK